jgi:DNA primase catalytic subunit
MKNLIIILLAISFISCNPFISKELRRKNKANRKLEKVINKFPELLKKDTAVVVYDTIIITESSKLDTVVSLDFDTITLIKDKLRLKLIKTTDTLIIDAECLPDTIRIKEFIKVPFNKVQKVELTTYEKIVNNFKPFFWWFILAIILYIAYKILSNFFPKIKL